MGNRKIGIGVALSVLLLSAVLGATVLREPIAYAASPFTSVIITNTAAEPVPVVEQAKTELVTQATLNNSTRTIDVDVARYWQVRFASGGTACNGGASLVIFLVEDGELVGVLDSFQFCDGSGLPKGFYETPGRTLRFVCNCSDGDSVEFSVWGRPG